MTLYSRSTRRCGPKEIQDYYTVLGVPPTAAHQVIEAAYWKKASAAAPMELDRLNEAYEVLGSSWKREAYDGERELNGAEPRKELE